MKRLMIVFIIIAWAIAIPFILSLTGCSGAGFEKRATLVPDRVGITFSQARYREEDAAYRGFTVGAWWDLK